MSRRQVYVLVGRWRAGEGVASALLPGTSSGGRGGGRLPDEMEAVVREVLRARYLTGSTISAHDRATLEQVWEAAGRPERGGLAVWKPYEQLEWDVQDAMLHAAAAAVHLAADGLITARGALGAALRP